MTYRDELEDQARQHATVLLDYLVQRSESVDFRQGTYLLAALAAELGGIVQQRCWDLAQQGDPTWEMGGAEAETLINAAWRCMATVAALSEQEDRRLQQREERERRQKPDPESAQQVTGEEVENHHSGQRGDVLLDVTTQEDAAMRSESADNSLHTLVPVIAEGRVLDAVAGRDLRGTLDDIAEALGLSYNDLRQAIDELTAIGWVKLELLSEALVLKLPEDARVAS